MVRTDMLRRMSGQEFYEWLAFYSIEQEQIQGKPKEQTPEQMLAILDSFGVDPK